MAIVMLGMASGSATVGWIFGLSLMAGVAPLPCAAIFYVGVRLGSPGDTAAAPSTDAAHDLVIDVERDSVHASDDAPTRRILVDRSTTLDAMLNLAMAEGYIPTISGGKATWIVESSGCLTPTDHAIGAMAVVAQQWSSAIFLIPDQVLVGIHFGTARPRLYFRYRCQIDPLDVAHTLKAGSTLARAP